MRSVVKPLRALRILPVLVLAGCVSTTSPPPQQQAARAAPASITLSQAKAKLAPITARMEGVAERECRARTPAGTNCDYKISVDERPNQPANAYQTLDKTGRPLIIFTPTLIAQTRNQDELAFVMGHEAAHHIAGHIGKTQNNAALGAILLGAAAAAAGVDGSALDMAVNTGAQIGGRAYSKNFELEADALGTIIAHKSGYNPVRGAEFFARIPDPGNQFLGTHPPNAARMQIVRETVAKL
ncbi:peptidase M48-like protein [Shimia isoporae]|uniref:Peptidase M48-like protein n=1 Tax=Shimia isoporae TaxID=647720 RepID=A0A4V2Q3X0_9RHOB|nr:M48 family metallopeptidase [Shimia isoporae]TCL08850.1 peptidase M48-like protein [Shimia isoporae]